MLAASLPATDAVSQSLIYKLSSEISRKMDHKPNGPGAAVVLPTTQGFNLESIV